MKMKFMALILSCLLLTGASAVHAGDFKDYDFQQDKMLLASDAIFMISSFESSDFVSAYSYYGDVLWNKKFHAKIVSWQIANDTVFVFSKARSGYKTYITCLDRRSGNVIWERE